MAKIYEAMEELRQEFPGRPFTPDGHLVGSIGEVIASKAFGFELYPPSRKGHDAKCKTRSDVQVKITAGDSVAFRGACSHLIALKLISPVEAMVIYDGSASGIWESAGKVGANGQKRVSLTKLRQLAQGRDRLLRPSK